MQRENRILACNNPIISKPYLSRSQLHPLPMHDILLAFITAFIPSYFIIPSVIQVAKIKHLCDEPGDRRSHSESTPSLGGIAIFAGIVFAVMFWTPFNIFNDLQYMLCSFVIIFLIGVKDDIIPMSAKKKLIGQLMAAGILVIKAEIRISSLHGLFGIYEIPQWFSIILTIFTIIVIINSFNLIDGINGLSGSISTLISMSLGTWFYLMGQQSLAILAFSLAGAVVAFLRYNFTPAKIFMGDTGALLLGLICSILIIRFIEVNRLESGSPYAFQAAPAMAIGILILPLFDTARVFTMRILRGRSPFSPDRLHIHHLLIDSGLSHMQATAVLVFATIGFMLLAMLLQTLGTFRLLGLILLIATVLSVTLQNSVEKRKKLAS
jgi:UDP-GlcNAc:undecaprenyl-phosphate/decaprenyl-phosphate GlcNAc-1-phosphate transferase